MDKRERHTNLVDVKERPTKKDRYLVLAKAQTTTTQAQAITTTTIAFGMRQFCAPFSLLLSPLATRSSLPPSLPTPSCPTHFLHSFLVVFIYLFSPFFSRSPLRAPCFANYNYKAEGDVAAPEPRLCTALSRPNAFARFPTPTPNLSRGHCSPNPLSLSLLLLGQEAR